jgi:RecB family exonuclease
MSLKMARLQKRLGFKVIAMEFGIGDGEKVTGFVDAVMEDKEGKWWIVDVKTTKALYLTNIPALCQDPQLNLYAAYSGEIAKKFDLDPALFAGCRWRVVTKPSLKRKANEKDFDYTARLLESAKAYDIAVPAKLMNPAYTLKSHLDLYSLAKKFYTKKAKPKKNYGNCMSYFKPCQFWSRCHPSTYSETNLEVISES